MIVVVFISGAPYLTTVNIHINTTAVRYLVLVYTYIGCGGQQQTTRGEYCLYSYSFINYHAALVDCRLSKPLRTPVRLRLHTTGIISNSSTLYQVPGGMILYLILVV